ncbi:hypothetical protein [Terrimonas pollutisoli]|uniref:hypothetical protein n=1 Tax=Terrimonas pollutisoli TaxID=3034147 RepID=UPI0023EB1718|nr:hypothetical protein [Terrimonas sp. H1YJ31]
MPQKNLNLFLIFVFFFPVVNISAQTNNIRRENLLNEIVFEGNHIQFNFSLLSAFKAQLKERSGHYPVNTTNAPGLQLGFKYQINFNNNYSLITGSEAVLTGRNFNIVFHKNDFSPPLIKDYNFKAKDTYLSDLILILPVLVEKRYLYKKTKFFFINAGARLNISMGADFDIFAFSVQNTTNDFINVAEINVYANNDAKPWISFPINGGHGWLLKNNNILQLAICSNLSFTRFVNGVYQVNIPNEPLTVGNYSSTGSYIGLSMNYVFTNANYRIRKAYEKINNK